MHKLIALVAVFALAAFIADSQPATADRGVSRFATLPEGQPGNPEGIAADAAGNIYGAEVGPKQVVKYVKRTGTQ